MKILAFADMHNSITAYKSVQSKVSKHNPDIIICAGDFTVFEEHIESMISKIDALGKQVLLINGNHEEERVTAKLCSSAKNITFMHKKDVVIDGVRFIGFGGGGFSPREPEFENFAKKLKLDNTPIVLITHAPPYSTKIDYLHEDHYGNISYADFIKSNNNVVLALSGHFHENFGGMDKLNRAVVANPGPAGIIFEVEIVKKR